MRILPFLLTAALLAEPALAMKPPREESPAPRDMVESFGVGSSDEELARAVAAADAHPLGTLLNPVRLGGPEGVHAYLARLRCPDGTPPQAGPKSTGGAGAFGSVTELHPLSCGTTRIEVAVDLYHEGHVENRAPAGLAILPPL